MDFATTIYLHGDQGTVPTYQLTCLPGRVALCMDTKEMSEGGIYLPSSGRFNPDTGTVVASGVDGLQVGDRVGVRPYDGAWFDNFQGKGRQVRLYGVADEWWNSVLFVLSGDDIGPTHDWCLVEREPAFTSELIISEKRPRWATRGRIESCGPDTTRDLGPGDLVTWRGRDEDELEFHFGKGKEFALIRGERIQAVIQ